MESPHSSPPMSAEHITFWKSMLLESLKHLHLSGGTVDDHSAIPNSSVSVDEDRKERLIHDLLLQLLAILRPGGSADKLNIRDAWSRSASILADHQLSTLLSESGMPSESEDEVCEIISLVLSLVFIAIVKVRGSRIYRTLLALNNDRQQVLQSIFQTFIDGNTSRKTLFEKLRQTAHEYQLTQVTTGEVTLLDGDTSFTFSPPTTSVPTPRSGRGMDSPIIRLVSNYQRIADTQSKLTLTAKFELDQEQEKSWELLENLKKSRGENNQLRRELQVMRKDLVDDAAASEIAELKMKIAKLEGELQKKSAKEMDCCDLCSSARDRSFLEEEARGLRGLLEEKNMAMNEYRGQVDSLQIQVSTLQTEKVGLGEALQEFQGEITELKNIIEELREKRQNTSDSACFDNQDSYELASNILLADLKQTTEMQEKETEAKTEALQELQNKLTAEKQAHNMAMNEYRGQVDSLQLQVSQMQTEKVGLGEAIQEFQWEITELKNKQDSKELASNILLADLKQTTEMLEKETEAKTEALQELQNKLTAEKQAHNMAMNEYRGQVDSLQLQVSQMQTEKVGLGEAIQEFQREITELKNKQDSKELASNILLADLKQTTEMLEKETEAKTETIQELQNKLTAEKQAHNMAMNEYRGQVDSLQLQVSQLQTEKVVLGEAIQEFQGEIMELKYNQDSKELSSNILLADLKQTTEILQKETEAKTEALQELQNKLTAEKETHNMAMNEYRGQVDSLQLQVSQLQTEKVGLGEAIQEFQGEITELKNKQDSKELASNILLADLKQTTEILQKETEAKTAVLQELQNKLTAEKETHNMAMNEYRGQVDSLQLQVSQLQTEKVGLGEAIQEFQGEITELKNNQDSKELASNILLAGLKQTTEMLEKETEAKTAVLQEFQNKLTAEKEAHNMAMNEYRGQVDSLQLQVSQLQTEKVGLGEAIQEFQGEITELKDIIEELREKRQNTSDSNILLADLKQTIEMLEKDTKAKTEALQELQNKLTAEKQALKDKYQTRLKDFADTISKKYQTKIEECQRHFESTLKEKTEMHQTASSKLDQKRGEVALLQSQLKEALEASETDRKAAETQRKKYEACKQLLAKSMKHQGSASNCTASSLDLTNRSSETKKPIAPPPPPLPQLVQPPPPENVDPFTFKQPSHTPGRSKPGRTQSERAFIRRPPTGTGTLFAMDDEPGETFSSSFLSDMKLGRCNSNNDGRLSELARRNTLVPAHLQSSYPAETQFFPCSSFAEGDLRRGSIVSSLGDKEAAAEAAEEVRSLAEKTSQLAVNSPAGNTRSRTSVRGPQQQQQIEIQFPTPTSIPARKRRSTDVSGALGIKRSKRDGQQQQGGIQTATNYSRPGPPTPRGRRNNITSTSNSSAIEDVNETDDGNLSHDRTPLLDTTNTSEVSTRSLKARFIETPQSLKKVLAGAFSRKKRRSYNVKPKNI